MFECFQLVFVACYLNSASKLAQGFIYTLPTDSNWPNSTQFQELKLNVKGKVSFKNDADYKPHTWNNITNTPRPAAIVQPTNTQDVIESLKFALKYNIRTSIQSTGHHQDHRNIYDNSIHIDMSLMNQKSIDLSKRTITLGPGNNFSQIQAYVSQQTSKKLVVLCGADPDVGIYGWTVGGGHGSLTRQYGLGVDALISIDLVLTNLTVVTASESQNQDLFRALRGSGGGAFGIAVSLTVRLYDDPGKISTFTGLYGLSIDTATMFADWIINAPNEAKGYYLPQNYGDKKTFTLISATCIGNSSFCSTVFSSLATGCYAIAPITCKPELEKYNSFYDFFEDQQSDRSGVVYLSSTSLNALNMKPALQEVTSYIMKHLGTGCSGNAVLGGFSATLDLDQTKTSVAREMRTSLMALTCFSSLDVSMKLSDKMYQVSVMDSLAESIFKKYSKWVYWNEPQHNFVNDDWRERYWGGIDNYNKLISVKRIYDPLNKMSCYHCVGYERVENEEPAICPAVSCTCSNNPQGKCNQAVGNKNFNFKIIFTYFIGFYFLKIKFI